MRIKNQTRQNIARLTVKDPGCRSNSISLTVSKASFKTAAVGVLLTDLATHSKHFLQLDESLSFAA